MMRRPHWLLLIVLIGLLAAGVQLNTKAALEPHAREIALAVSYKDIDDPLWWPRLEAAGVHFALVTTPTEVAELPPGVAPVALVDHNSQPLWQEAGLHPAAYLFQDNLYNNPMAEAILAAGVPVGIIEFKPQGDFALYPYRFRGQLFRAYNQAAHPFISEYTIAAGERQADLIVVNLNPAGDPPLGPERALAVSEALVSAGHRLTDRITPRSVLELPPLIFWPLLAAAVALAIWFFSLLIPSLSGWGLMALAFLPIIAAGVAYRLLGLVDTARLAAFGAAILFPISGITLWWKRTEPVTYGARRGAPGSLALADFALLMLFALAGGLLTHALLAEYNLHLNILQFVGVKLAYIVPLVWCGLLILIRLWRHGFGQSLLARRQSSRRWLLLLLALLILFAFYVLLNRTGNQSRVPIFGWELRFRQWLYETFGVRPRTKEFLGYPLLLLGLYFWRRNDRLLGGAGVLLGFTGLLSFVNTFAHAHHPILLSLLRGAWGLAIGLGLGLIGLLLIPWFLPREGSHL